MPFLYTGLDRPAPATSNVHLNSSKSDLSDLSQANIEALAYELDEVTITCGQYYGQCWTMKPWGECVFTGDQYNWCF
jgi:hypothetical protein